MIDEEGKNQQPIIIVKKKSKHGSHHGGAWKVAYADFVTAMMAFFLVMWLVSQSEMVRNAVQMYFQDPQSFLSGKGSGLFEGSATPIGIPGEEELAGKLKRERQGMLNVAKRIKEAIENIPELAGLKEFVEIEVTQEGLRIQLIDSDEQNGAHFFDIGSARLKPGTTLLLSAIAMELGKMPNYIVIEGHTDSRNYSGGKYGYSNWELSADRANSARKLMESAGLSFGQVVEIRGNADRRPRIPNNPADPRNRRVAIILLNEESAKRYMDT